jgi:hypothetical protein
MQFTMREEVGLINNTSLLMIVSNFTYWCSLTKTVMSQEFTHRYTVNYGIFNLKHSFKLIQRIIRSCREDIQVLIKPNRTSQMWASSSHSELNEGGLTVQFPDVYMLTLKHYFFLRLRNLDPSLWWNFPNSASHLTTITINTTKTK